MSGIKVVKPSEKIETVDVGDKGSYSEHLVDEPKKRINRFVLVEGDEYKDHSNAGWEELIVVTSGQVSFAISGEEPETLKQDSSVTIPEGAKFDLEGIADKTVLMCFYTIDGKG